MLNIPKSMYENVSCCVRSGHDYTEFFESPAGVKQCCLLSPKCFSLFINKVADEIRKAGRHGILLSNLSEEVFSLLFAGFTHFSGTAKSTKRAGMHFHKDGTLSELKTKATVFIK